MDVSSEPELRSCRLVVPAAPSDAGAKEDQEAENGHRGAPYRHGNTVARVCHAVWLSVAVLFACEAREPASPSKSAAAPLPAPASAAIAPGVSAGALSGGAAPEEPASIRCLVRLYGGAPRLRGAEWFLETSTGAAIAYDDRRAKSFDEQLASPDVEDAFRDRYRRGPLVPVTQKDFDPGRTRLAPVFAAAYGATAAEVEHALVRVRLVSGTVSVHTKAADALRRVAARLEKLVAEHPDWKPFFEPLGGGFNWRTVAGTELQSAHSFGVAVDLNPKLGAYWRWQKEWKNQVPDAIVDAFESEGFAWGGRWFHFDTMHFEYRPELFDEACYGDAKAR